MSKVICIVSKSGIKLQKCYGNPVYAADTYRSRVKQMLSL